MKRLFADSHKWMMVLALLAVAFLACDNGDDGTGGGDEEPVELPELADLVGRWGISQTVSGGNSQTGVPCENTLEVTSSGGFTYVDVARGSWLEGTMAFDVTDSSLTLTIGSETIDLKLLSIEDGAFTLQSEDNDGGTVTLSTQIFTALESGDCPGIELSQVVNKWSISSFSTQIFELQGEGDELGNVAGTEEMSNIPVNRFTTEFVGDGTYLTIDLVNEYDYSVGEFRRLDDHNMVLTFEDDEDEVEMLVHLTAIQGNTATFQTVRYSDDDGDGENDMGESRIVTSFTMTINDETVPTITEAELMGKWSVSAVTEAQFSGGQLLNENINDDIASNKMTLGFREENELLLIDLVLGPQIRLGDYEMLDASNILINLGDEDEGDDGDGGDDEEEDYEIFQLTSNSNGQIILQSFDRVHEDDQQDYDVESFEITLTKNDGSEPTVGDDELLGTWMVTEVEGLGENANGGGDDEGPQVGMLISFDAELAGDVSFEGQTVFVFDYEFLDLSNLLLTFQEEDGAGNAEESFNLFHVNARPGENLELLIYSVRTHDEGGDGDGGDGGEDEGDSNMELQFSIVLQKQ